MNRRDAETQRCRVESREESDAGKEGGAAHPGCELAAAEREI